MWDDAQSVLQKDRYIGPLIVQFGPCNLTALSKEQYFERLVRAIIGQQLSTKAATTIFERVKNAVKGDLSARTLHLFSGEKLKACGLSRAKVSYIQDLAEKTVSGKLKLCALEKMSNEEVTHALVAVKGVGVWTAEMFLMFSLARPDVFPVGDLGIRKAIVKLLCHDMTKEEMVEFAIRWKPYRTVASYYLWKYLDEG